MAVRLMGVVNAAPDSFSDPGPRTTEQLVAHGLELVEAGAAIVDVGGDSGRTDRPAVAAELEATRVSPIVEALAAEGIAVSVDTWRAPVADAALAAGATIVNDPSGLADRAVADACARHGGALVITHTRVPPKEKGFPGHDDLVADVVAFWRERAEAAKGRGVPAERLLFDPGIDLGKTPAESVELLRRLDELAARRLMVAVSRKDFIGALCGRPPAARDAGTLAALEAAVAAGAAIVRVHDVAGAADYLRVRAALRGDVEVPADLRVPDRLLREGAPV